MSAVQPDEVILPEILTFEVQPYLNAALRYAARGWAVLPMHSVYDGLCTCGDAGCRKPGKHPLTLHGKLDATADPDQVREWWTCWPWANIAVVLGLRSGIVALDIDDEQAFADLTQRAGHPPATLTNRTGGGGRHLIFRSPEGGLATVKMEKLEILGDGACIHLPPSRHVSGRKYEWSNDLEPIASDWLVAVHRALVDEREAQRAARPVKIAPAVQDMRPRRGRRIIQRAVKYIGQMPEAISKQGGHDATFKVALVLVRGFALDPEIALEIMAKHYNPRCRPPWSNTELRHKLEDALVKGTTPMGGLLGSRKRRARNS